MHVRAVISFQAEALDIKLAGHFYEIVVTRHMFELTVVPLQKDSEKVVGKKKKKKGHRILKGPYTLA